MVVGSGTRTSTFGAQTSPSVGGGVDLRPWRGDHRRVDPEDMKQRYELAEAVVFTAGLYLGVLPFAAHLFGFDPTLSVTSRLPDPWWWIGSAVVVVLGLGLLERLDRAKRRS